MRVARVLALSGLLGLFALILMWNVWLDPPRVVPRALVLILLLTPLLLPLRGMMAGRLYTHAWATYLAMPYFVLGVFHAAGTGPERGYGWLMVCLSIAWLAGAAVYPRLARRQSGHTRG
ncbi:DUF2069 domain-containing protein [Thioalkalivibrio thiocyanodenitrificans]|uniref:DUF2069 domain-containing protein n=1 Tax=Thioalkalivibrio thiocyanodenitrificans TaxID=243063 RepID=UPI00035E0D8F|nr:DUF2069 domain-containing protein [Thioalkalivibrio thiocyanodenitrificans]